MTFRWNRPCFPWKKAVMVLIEEVMVPEEQQWFP
jgi:hypothetical protein